MLGGVRRVCGVAALAAVVLLAVVARGQADPPEPAQTPFVEKTQRFVPKPPGTKETLRYWFGPYTVPPGQDLNRVDIDLPVQNGFIISVEPGMRRTSDLSEPPKQEGHIHHAHWFALDPGNKEDTYTGGNTEWIFGNGDEETKADFSERSAADPNGPIYGQFVGAAGPQLMIYMLHNKTSQPLNVWIQLDVTFVHGTEQELAKLGGRPYRDVTGVLFGRTYDVPRRAGGDGTYETSEDEPEPIEWTSTVDGTIIGTGGHLHPGGLSVVVENMGRKSDPCPDDGRGYGGTLLYRGDALFNRGALFSEDYQIEVTRPAWRAPIRKGDRIRLTGIYANKDNAWYDVMTHEGIYIDTKQPPRGRCKPYLVGGEQEQRTVVNRRRHVHFRIARSGKLVRRVHVHRSKRTVGIDPTKGVPNRPFGHHPDPVCGLLGTPDCERPETPRPAGAFTDTVTIANFLYIPGDRGLTGDQGAPPRVRQGSSLRFVNADESAGIRHTVTTCRLPCNGRYVANYPRPDGAWDSDILGYDPVDGGSPNPVAETPKDLPVGRYAYFCRIHPWMRGQFEVVK